MKIADRVYLVGSGAYSCELSHSRDCNVYVIDGGGEYAMIDAGSGIAPELIVARIEACGIPMAKVTRLLLTHIHGDHAAGAYYFHKEYGLKVYAASEAAAWLEQGDMDKTSVNAAKRAGVYDIEFQYPACPVAGHMSDGDRITVGDLELHVLETPGHARGHVSFVMEEGGARALFSGDAIFANGRIYVQNCWDCSIQDYASSIAKLHELQVDRLYPGHGAFVMNRAGEHIAQAHRCFERLDLPPNL